MLKTESNTPGWLRSSICIAIAILGTGYSLWLRTSGLVSSEAALFGFTCLFLFLAIVVYVLPQLQELNLKELKVSLREIKEVEQRIYARADTIRALTIKLADILTMLLLNISRLNDIKFMRSLRSWQAHRLTEILKMLDVKPEEIEHLKRFQVLYDRFDASVTGDQNDPANLRAAEEALKKIQELLNLESPLKES
jgi:hypothetical protein